MFARTKNKIVELNKLQSINDILSKMYVVEDDTLYCVIATPNASKKEKLGEVVITGENIEDCILNTDMIEYQNRSVSHEYSRLEKLSKHIDITKYHIRKIFSKSNNPETYTLIAIKGYNQEGDLVWELL